LVRQPEIKAPETTVADHLERRPPPETYEEEYLRMRSKLSWILSRVSSSLSTDSARFSIGSNSSAREA
jgi:hypothetical protein